VPAFVAYWGNNGQVRASAFCDVPGLPKPFELVDVLQFRTLNVPYDAVFSGQFSDLGVRSYLFVGHSFDNFAFHQPGWSALWKVNSQSEMFGRECNLLRPVFFVGQKAVVKVSCIDVLEPRAFLKQVAEIDSRNVKPVLFCCFNDCSPQSGESTCLAGGGYALMVFIQIVVVYDVIAGLLISRAFAIDTRQKNVDDGQQRSQIAFVIRR
jgi:hypothetical protein